LIAGALFFPLYLHIERGQIDLLALLLLIGAWPLRARAGAAGAALAAAAALKPGLLGVLPVIAALGRWRVLAAFAAWGAVLVAATVVVSGPRLVAEYATTVLPRAARYGEGGTREMLLPAERLVTITTALDSGAVVIDGRSYRAGVWDGPVAASWPRLLGPEGPSPAALILPYGAALVVLIAVARAVHRRGRPPAAEALVFFAAAVACVVTSPSGWTMGLVLALPLVPLTRAARAAGVLGRARAGALGLALALCACPPVFTGSSALAGAALVVVAAVAAVGVPAAPDGRP
jgi:hypothetical protein